MKKNKFSPLEIKKYLKYPFSIECFDTIDSTSNYARKKETYYESDFLICADRQTAGRGRRGNSFISTEDGCYFTFAYHPNCLIEDIGLITIKVAIAIIHVLKKWYDIELKIKWVNDLYFQNKKCGGILTESIMDIDCKIKTILIGIGINVNIKELDSSIQGMSTSLFLNDWNKNLFVARIINEFKDLNSVSNAIILEEYEQKLVILNKEINYLINGIAHHGIVNGINEKGNLIIEENSEEITLCSGEISLNSESISNILK